MPDELVLFTFRFEQTIPTKQVPVAAQPSYGYPAAAGELAPPSATDPSSTTGQGGARVNPTQGVTTEQSSAAQAEAERNAVQNLNVRADELAKDIERTIERLLTRVVPPPVAVQADVTFSVEASIELAGMVVLWVAGVAGPPIQKELANWVQTAVRRVVNRVLATEAQNPASPVAGGVSSLNVQSSSANLSPPPAMTTVLTPPASPAAAVVGGSQPALGTQWQFALMLLNTALLAVVLVLLVLIVLPAGPNIRSSTSTPTPAATPTR